MSAPPTREQERWHQRLRDYGSILDRTKPVSIHHVIGASVAERIGVRGTVKQSHWLVLPLTYEQHQGTHGLHAGIETWEARHNVTEAQLIDKLCLMFKVDLWALAVADRLQRKETRQRKMRCSKIIPHTGKF